MRMIHCMWLCCGYLVILLYSNTIITDAIRHVNYLCFSPVSSRGDTSGACPTRGGWCTWGCTRRWYTEHVKHVKNTQFEVGSWQVADLKGCISSDKSAMASWTAPFWSTISTSGCMSSKPMHLVHTMQKAANISRSYNKCWLTSHCVLCPSIAVFSMHIKRRRLLFNTNHNCIFRNYQIS